MFSIDGCFARGLFLHVKLIIEQRQIIMSGKIIRIDVLKRLKLLTGSVVIFLKIIGVAQFLPGLTEARVRFYHRFQITRGLFQPVLQAADQSPIKQRAEVVRFFRQRFLEKLQRRAIIAIGRVCSRHIAITRRIRSGR